jgi:hypothetical protein
MAPPERPDPPPVPAPAEVASGAPEEVDDGNSGGSDVGVGSSTSAQRFSTFAETQHESVALGELEAQNPQRPGKLD